MKNTIKTILLSAVTLAAGFIAMSVPFRLFDNLSQMQMRILLIAEVIIYFIIFSVVFLKKEANAQRKAKEKELKEKHNKRVLKRKQKLSGITVQNFDLAA